VFGMRLNLPQDLGEATQNLNKHLGSALRRRVVNDMPTAYEVPAEQLLKKLTEQLRRQPQISPPPWALFAKTGAQAERPPQDREWWYARAASILRKLYFHAPLSLRGLKAEYGGTRDLGHRPRHQRDGGGSSIRKILRQLEEAGLVMKRGREGRILTSKGTSLLDKASAQIFAELVKVKPQLTRYG